MAIDRLSSTSSLLAALRSDLARKTSREETKPRATSTQAAGKARENARDPDKLRRELTEIVRGVQPDDQQSVDAARPRIVRAVLLWEFGSGMREHPDWQPMLQNLLTTLQNSDSHQAELVALIKQLQR